MLCLLYRRADRWASDSDDVIIILCSRAFWDFIIFFTDIRESYVVLSRVRCGEIFGLMLQMVRPHLCSWNTWDQTEPQSSDESNFCLLHRSFSPTNMLLMSSNESCTSAGTAVWILGGSDTKSHTHRVELCVRVFVRLLFLFPGSADPVFVHRGC